MQDQGFIAFIGFIICIWLLSHRLDAERIKEYIESRGGKLLESTWTPFGRGWFGERGDRIYRVRYLDINGNEHNASCKTSMWSGVYWTEDYITKAIDRSDHTSQANSSLEEENRRLRDELARMKDGRA